ncbi:MAG TPA: LuxR C-terminal-related transcriptional regulator [Myxococcaceae bacterium]|nr:LuxR C-terminal-related transcriptional regulator [Myxococcaceae bacterium]
MIPHELGVFHSAPPVPPGIEPVTLGLSEQANRRLRARWTSQAPDAAGQYRQAESLGPAEGARLFSRLCGELMPGTGALVIPLERGSQVRAWLLLGRKTPVFSESEVDLARLLAPLLSLGDAHPLELPEAVGAALSRREAEIFEYLCRGLRNQDIAEALGTSEYTVRNQLVRLYRKVGVCTRSELVGLASSVIRRATQ